MKTLKKPGARKRKHILQDRILALMGFDFGDEFDIEKAEALYEDFLNTFKGKTTDLPDLQQFLETAISVSRKIADSAENMEFSNDEELKQYMDNFVRDYLSGRQTFSTN